MAAKDNQEALSWFEFLFDEKGELLKDHLKSSTAEPTAAQLIVQFLERSGICSNNNAQTVEHSNPVDSKRFKRLKQLALQVGFHMEWNLETFENSLSLHWQKLFFDELLKTQVPQYKSFLNGQVCLKELDKQSAMALVIYCRWVIRTLAQHFLPNIGKPKTGLMEAAENENTLKNLKEQLSTSISILEDALLLTEDLELPCPFDPPTPSKTDTSKIDVPPETSIKHIETSVSPSDTDTGNATCEKASDHVATKDTESTSGKTEGNSSTPPDITDEQSTDKTMNVEDSEKTSEETSKSYHTSCTQSVKVNIKELVAQVSFDLGTLYFYQEKFEKAAKLFQHCKESKCCTSSCYTVNEDMLHGYYMSCCGLLNIPPKITLFSSDHEGRGYNVSLFEKVEHCRISSPQDMINLLIQDNIALELPMDYRHALEKSTLNEETIPDQPGLPWQIAACNAIRQVIENKPLNAIFWDKVKKGLHQELQCILSLCSKTFQEMKKSSALWADSDTRFLALKSFVLLLCSCVDNGFEVAKNSEADVFVQSLQIPNDSPMDEKEPLTWKPVDIFGECDRDDADLRCGWLLHKLRSCFDAVEISSLIEELHRIQPSRRFHNENFTCMTYKSCLDGVQDPVVQDLLHVILSKSLHCCTTKRYGLCEEMLSFALGRLTTLSGSGTEIERVKAVLHQELLLTDLQKHADRQKNELIDSVKSYLKRTKNIPSVKADNLAVAYLLNMKKFSFLSTLRVEGEDDISVMDTKKLGSLLASASLSITKPQEWRKSIRLLWDGVLRVFTTTLQQKRPQEGRPPISIRRDAANLNLSSFNTFVGHLKDETCLGVLISCLVRLFNLSKDGQENFREIFSSYGHLWPTSITNRNSVNFEQIETAMMHITQHGVKLHPYNVTWIQTLADIFLNSKNFPSAFKRYLESGACSSSLFAQPVPVTVWDSQIFRKMVDCCMQLKAHIQGALLCQCVEPKDYVTAFKAIQLTALSSEDAMDRYYSLFWDVTMLEYLINTHFKQGQHDKKQLAIQTISQAELNIFNNQEVLQRAESIRKSSLFRSLSKQYL